MDLNDTPEQAAYRTEVRAWLEQNASHAPVDARTRRRGGGRRGAPRLAAAARRGGLRRRDVAGRARRAGQGPAPPGRHQPGDRARRRAGDPRRDRRRHARPDDHRARQRRAEAALPRADAARRRGLVPAVLRAGRRLRPRRHPVARAAGGRRLLAPLRPEGVDDERAVRRLRAAARAHRPGRAQAQGPHDVRRADGRRGRDDPPAAPDLRRARVQRGLLRRREAGAGLRSRRRSTAAGASR